MSVASEFAPAKVNLYLHVVGRRADGYHLLDSLVGFASIGDSVSAVPADALSLAVGGPFARTLQDDPVENLVLRATRLLAEACGVRPAVALRLEKHLPIASGIGGGSADAAAALRLLSRLWNAPTDVAARLAPQLGADVPVCLSRQAARLSGVGERIEPAPALPRVAIVLVNPGVPLSTPAVFRARQGGFREPAPNYPRWATAAGLADWLRPLGNDLAAPAMTLAPVIDDVLSALATQPGCLLARLSGSGATCFGLFAEAASAERAAKALQASVPEWWVRSGTLAPSNDSAGTVALTAAGD